MSLPLCSQCLEGVDPEGEEVLCEVCADELRARVVELEAAVRTLHALAESHFGEGTIDVPAMPELNRK